MCAVVYPRAAAVPSRPSVIVTPRNPRLVRSSVALMAGDQREIDVDAERLQRDACLVALTPSGRRRAERSHLGWRKGRRRPRNALDGAALLVDGDQEPRLSARNGCRVELAREGDERRL